MKVAGTLGISCCLATGLAHFAFAESPELTLRLSGSVLKSERTRLPTQFVGRLEYSGNPFAKGAICFYLPYNDRKFGEDWASSRHFEVAGESNKKPFFRGGEMRVTVAKNGLRSSLIRPDILRVTRLSPAAVLSMEVTAELPRRPYSARNEVMFDLFFPVLLEVCPGDDDEAPMMLRRLGLPVVGNIAFPPDWEVASANAVRTGPGTFGFDGKGLSFALLRGFQKMQVGPDGDQMTLFHQSRGLEGMAENLSQSYGFLRRWLGPLPYRKLVVVETSELYRPGMPGLISFNQPRQSLFLWLQHGYLNWSYWALVNLISYQWLGGVITAPRRNDLWLIEGTMDYLALESLRVQGSRFKLIRSKRSPIVFFNISGSPRSRRGAVKSVFSQHHSNRQPASLFESVSGSASLDVCQAHLSAASHGSKNGQRKSEKAVTNSDPKICSSSLGPRRLLSPA